MRFLAFTLFCFFMALPAYAQQQVNMRTGEHRGYTRLVFDWPETVTYKIEEEDEKFIIRFEKPGQVNTDVSGKNIQSISVLSEDPLTVSVAVPAGAKTRSFPVRSRIVLDVYDPSGVASAVKTPSKTKDTRKAAAVRPAVKPQESASTPDEQDLQNVQKAIRNVENIVAEVLNKEEREIQAAMRARANENAKTGGESSKVNEGANANAQKTLAVEEAAKAAKNANMFTVSSTKSIGLAVFDNMGQMWIVTDRADTLVQPQVSGPDSAYFKPIKTSDIQGGQSHVSKTMPATYMRGRGGGLLWNIVISPDPHEEIVPVKAERQNVREGRSRGASLLFPFATPRKVMDIKDPLTGSMLKVITVEDSGDFTGRGRDYVDFTLLPSSVGLAIRPKVDDLKVDITDNGVLVSRPGGLTMLPVKQVTNVEKRDFATRMAQPKDERRIFDFEDWRMGGLAALNENRNIILSSMNGLTKGTQIENLITLGKMQLANGRGAEAIGFLDYAATEIPELKQNPEFLSLLGVAKAFDWKTDEAFKDLSSPILSDYEEIDIWKAFALADLGDWQQAYEVLPANLSAIKDYPSEIRNRLVIVLAEIYLRAGERAKAEQLFELVADSDNLNRAHDAALRYLKGEAARQKGDLATTKNLWSELADGKDDLYRVKAGLALTRLKIDQGEMKPAEAIDNLERLRYAWRGDELESTVGYWLGRTYFESGEYVKGLKIMRDAATLVPDTILGQRITGDMSALFTDFYLGEGLDDVSPLDAVALYEEFTELVPSGEVGNQVISNLAEHLVKADLLDRSADLLTYQINHRLSGDQAARTATRLAAIQLIDKNGPEALQTLQKAEGFMKDLPDDVATPARYNELALLRARALSLNNQTEQALNVLENLKASPDNNRLRADIAWRSGFWDDAAYALEDVILDENISLTRPLSDEHAMLILQRAVALNLSGDRIGLANMREKYAEAMRQTSKSRLFEVVTRARKNAELADRRTLLSTVSEVDLFADFLNSYREVDPANPSN
tara:strand:+ start:12134 stop:15181 length:3048 start_codon:yes stop_codon:yes gene_type:complete